MPSMRGAARWGAALVLGALALTGQVSRADDAARADEYFAIAERWVNYATHGQQYPGDFVVDNLRDARQERLFYTVLENRLRSARAAAQARLDRERQHEYDYSSGGPNVVVGPDLATLRQLQQRKVRDLERTVAAFDAVLACLEGEDDRCPRVREIELERATWRSSGDPLPADPSVPQAADLREMLESALSRHRVTLEGYRRAVSRLQRVTNDVAGAHIVFVDRLGDLRSYRGLLGELEDQLEARRQECARLCDEARALAAEARRSADTAAAAGRRAELEMAGARSAAAACRTAADADRVEAAVDAAEAARDAMAAASNDAVSANDQLQVKLADLGRRRDVSVIRQRWEDERARSNEAGGAIIDQLVTLERSFGEVAAPRAEVAGITDALRDLGFVDDEAASWERALAEDPTTRAVMRQRFDAFRREYEVVRFQAGQAVAWADELTARLGGPDLLGADFREESARLSAHEDRLRTLTVPDCEAIAVDLSGPSADPSRLQNLLGDAPSLRHAAQRCRSGAAAPGAPSGGSTPPAAAPAGSTTPASVSAPAAPPSPDPNVFGGLVIAGLASPAKIPRGTVVQLRGEDHGGRVLPGVEWVTSNEQVLPVDQAGRIVGREAGEAMVLAKLDGMRAWLDVEVVDPGGPPTPGGGAGPVSPSGGGSAGPAAPGGPGPAPGGPATGDGGFDFSDAGSGSTGGDPPDDGLLGVPPTPEADRTPAATDPGGFDFSDGGAGSVEPAPLDGGLLGVPVPADGAGAPPPGPGPLDLSSADGTDGGAAPATAADLPAAGDWPDPSGSLFAAAPGPSPAPPPQPPAGPSQADIVQMLNQVDCSWLEGGAAAYDTGTGTFGCTCPPGTQLSTARPACLDCAGLQSQFMATAQAQQYGAAQQVVTAAEGCDWAPSARAHLRDLHCIQLEMAVLGALERQGPGAARALIQSAQAEGCSVTAQTQGLVAAAGQPPPDSGWAPPPGSRSTADQVAEMMAGVMATLSAVQGGGAGASTGSPPPGPSVPSGGRPGGGSGLSREECKQRLCGQECANAIGLLTEATTAPCERCLKQRAAELDRCTGGGAGSTGSGAATDSAFSSGSGAWAFPQWTEPTGEGGGQCRAGSTYTQPHRYAIACDGNDGSALYKLTVGGYPAMVFGPASFTDCQRYLARLTGGR